VGPPPQGIDDLADYVLAPFEREELDLLDPLWQVMAEAAECWLAEGIEVAIQRFNRRKTPPSTPNPP
jgi:peptidyl-tRNA hydrolase